MHPLSSTRTKLATVGVAVAVLGGAGTFALGSGVFASSAASGASLTSASAPAAGSALATRAGAGRHGHGLLARSDHATVEVHRHGHWVTFALNRGNVTAVSSTSITLDRPDGVTITISLAPTTKYKGVEAASGIVKGRRATVISDNGTALRVRQASGAKASATTAPTSTTPAAATAATTVR